MHDPIYRGSPEIARALSANDCLRTWNRYVVYMISFALRYRIVRLQVMFCPPY